MNDIARQTVEEHNIDSFMVLGQKERRESDTASLEYKVRVRQVTEVFIPDCGSVDNLRDKIECISHDWIERTSPFPIRIIHKPADMTYLRFNRFWRREAMRRASDDCYLLIDSDIVAFTKKDFIRGLEILRTREDFAMLAAYPFPNTIADWKPTDCTPIKHDEIMEHYSCGGFRFCRKIEIEFPDSSKTRGYDSIYCKAIRESGMKVGYLKNVNAFHIGQHCSHLWKSHA